MKKTLFLINILFSSSLFMLDEKSAKFSKLVEKFGFFSDMK
jgi:hypothetical protein